MNGREVLARFDRLEFDQESDEGPEGLTTSGGPESDEQAWFRKADEQRRRGLHENALRFYSRALELDRSLLPCWVGQVQMLVLLGEYPEAELWARKSLEQFKGQGDLMAGRAQALARLGDRRQALELADASLRQEGNAAYRWVVRGELLITGKDDIDRHCFDKAVQADRDWLVPLEIALIYLHYDQPSKALLRAGTPSRRARRAPSPGTPRAAASRSWASTDRPRPVTAAARSSLRGTSTPGAGLPRSPTRAGRFQKGCAGSLAEREAIPNTFPNEWGVCLHVLDARQDPQRRGSTAPATSTSFAASRRPTGSTARSG